jgi:predicted outer membrane repeat protein
MVALLCVGLPQAAFPDTLEVPGQYSSIQEAIDAANSGDTVLVSPGTYVENIDFLGKAIVVTSVEGPDVTMIDGGDPIDPDFGSVALFNKGEGPETILEGFSLLNGTGTFCSSYNQKNHGGGIFCWEAAPTIRNNILSGNRGFCGGGIFCLNWFYLDEKTFYPSILDNVITGNLAEHEGGGIFLFNTSPDIANNLISDNEALKEGGGIFGQYTDSEISSNIIRGNRASNDGGGICLGWVGCKIVGNRIMENESLSGFGGGIFNEGAETGMYIQDNVICGNEADLYGGGIYSEEFSIITNNMIAENSAHHGGGAFFSFYARPTITNNTVVRNSAEGEGGGFNFYWCHSKYPIMFTNTILWDNEASSGPEMFLADQFSGSSMTISHCDVKGGLASIHVGYAFDLNWGAGMIDSDPLFVESDGCDFHLIFDSPCRDSGTFSAAALPFKDFEGDPRKIFIEPVDIGADEFHTHLYCTGNAAAGGLIKAKLVGMPAASPVGLFLGSGVLDPPLQTQWGDFYLQAPWLLMPLSPIPANGVLVLTAVIPSWPTPPYDLPMQGLIGVGSHSLTNPFILEVR